VSFFRSRYGSRIYVIMAMWWYCLTGDIIAVRPYGMEVQDRYTRPIGIFHHGISKLFHLNCVSYNFI